MAKQDVGAIIIIDTAGDIHENILDTGTRLGAVISAGLLESIFNTKAPLHDGAVIVRGNKIVAAGCFLTLTQRNVNKEMGTRHRAAIGITEETDVLSIVVSEETGIISVVKHGEIKRYMTMDKLKDEIEDAYGISPTALARRAEQNSKKKRFGKKDRFDI
jgi:diadenylate cyclase